MYAAPPSTIDITVKEKDLKLGSILAQSDNGNHHTLTSGEVKEKPQQYEGLQQSMVTLKYAQEIIQEQLPAQNSNFTRWFL